MCEFPNRLRLVSFVLGASALAVFASTGCVVHHGAPHGSIAYTVKAPPRVAAHGYVHRHHGVVLVFDRSWNGYWVRAHPGHYFHVDRYYRWYDGRWQRARRFAGPWATVELRSVPAGLRHRSLAKTRRGRRIRYERW
jgi:hypothetical protein